MKTKVFALILAILCLSMTVVGCGNECTEHIDENKDAICDKCEASLECETHVDEDEDQTCDVCGKSTAPACEKHVDENRDFVCDTCSAKLCDHKDENADNVCDACKLAIVAIDVQLPPEKEERVEMVVNAIPDDVALDTYINTSVVLPKYESVEKIEFDSIHDRYALISSNNGGSVTEYTVKNLVTGGDPVYSTTLDTSNGSSISLLNFFIRVATKDSATVTTYEYISYNGISFFTETVDSAAGELPTDLDNFDYYYSHHGGCLYVKLLVDGKYYVFDYETSELLFSDISAKTFVDRPYFSVETESYGYRENNEKLYIYDLSKWIDCVYTYEVPSYALNFKWIVLENGNVLIQQEVELPDHAVNYDFIHYGIKYDLVNLIVDVAKKSATEVEFGYLINPQISTKNSLLFNDEVTNLVSVYPIINDRVDYEAEKQLIIDNDLKVLYDCAQTLDFGDDISRIQPVGENLFRVVRDFDVDGYGYTVYEIINEKGEHLNYLPTSADVDGTYVKYEGKYYNYRMELMVDPAAEGYTVETYDTYYVILSKDEGGNRSYYVFDGTSISKIDLNVTMVYDHALGYVVAHEESGNTVYSLYSDGGDLILKSEYQISSSVTDLDGENGVYLVSTYGSTYYVVK